MRLVAVVVGEEHMVAPTVAPPAINAATPVCCVFNLKPHNAKDVTAQRPKDLSSYKVLQHNAPHLVGTHRTGVFAVHVAHVHSRVAVPPLGCIAPT